ncbi:CopG family transcriptional regulator [Nostoc sp. FACHB-152]|nr:CopG family transcriptional regulator [Nostoc sp. FACHB-152]MBD2468112.1 CopG family transcriptional regulator [Nostoc sp. FACHB-145]
MSCTYFKHNLDERLDAIAAGINRDRNYITNAAIDAYLETYQWQIEETQSGIAEADAEDFANDEEVKAIFVKHIKAN